MIEEFRSQTLSAFHDLPVFDFAFEDPEDLRDGGAPEDVETWAWRVRADTGGPEAASGEDVFRLFLEAVDTARIRALILGAWSDEVPGDEMESVQQQLVAVADRFPALEALFLADIPSEVSEVSWIGQPDPRALLAAFPRLKVLGMRGGWQNPIKPFEHDGLEELVLQSGGLSVEVVRAVGHSRLPALQRLDLYLGTARYGGGATADDLAPILAGTAFPGLRHLGLRDAENADGLAAVLAHAPVVSRLESLDLSLGTLGDAGAAALLAGQPLTHLARLDLHHHFMSAEMVERLWEALPTVDVDMSERLLPEDDEDGIGFRYVAVAE